jgi:hypothetical protein
VDCCFKRFQSTVRPFEESRRLIDVPYWLSRNPIYLGKLILAGAQVLLGSVGPIVVA